MNTICKKSFGITRPGNRTQVYRMNNGCSNRLSNTAIRRNNLYYSAKNAFQTRKIKLQKFKWININVFVICYLGVLFILLSYETANRKLTPNKGKPCTSSPDPLSKYPLSCNLVLSIFLGIFINDRNQCGTRLLLKSVGITYLSFQGHKEQTFRIFLTLSLVLIAK